MGSEGIGNVVFTLVLESEVTNTWRRAIIAASNVGQWTRAFVKASVSIVAVVTNASVAHLCSTEDLPQHCRHDSESLVRSSTLVGFDSLAEINGI